MRFPGGRGLELLVVGVVDERRRLKVDGEGFGWVLEAR